jgi:hypothetical protein
MVMVEENIGTFQVSVHNVQIMQCSQPMHDLYGHFPNIILCEITFLLLIPLNLLKEVSIVSVLHDDAKVWARLCFLVDKRLIILDHIAIRFNTR